MGKKRVQELLEHLKTNQAQELENAAAIFTVAQVAVNELERMQVAQDYPGSIPALPGAPVTFTKAELLKRYGSYQGCRQAAKHLGIQFAKTPSWEQLAIAFSYLEAVKTLLHSYVRTYPHSALKGISIHLKLETPVGLGIEDRENFL